MKAVALVLLLSFGAQAQDRTVLEVKDGVIRTVDGQTREVTGGAYLPSATLIEVASEVAALRAEVRVLREPDAKLIALCVGLVVTGIAAGYVVGRISP